jgi:hypothetical protein
MNALQQPIWAPSVSARRTLALQNANVPSCGYAEMLELTEAEFWQQFIRTRDSFYMAAVSEST